MAFKVGDKVVCVRDSCRPHIKNGQVYTVTKAWEDYISVDHKLTGYYANRFQYAVGYDREPEKKVVETHLYRISNPDMTKMMTLLKDVRDKGDIKHDVWEWLKKLTASLEEQIKK